MKGWRMPVKRRLFALILVALLAMMAALAEEDSITTLKGDDVPPLPERLVELIGDIPGTKEAFLARPDVAEMDALMKGWDAEATIKALWETGTCEFPNLDHEWVESDVSGRDMTMEVSGDHTTLTLSEKQPFEWFEIKAASDSEHESLYLAADMDSETGALVKKHSHRINACDDEQYGFFYYTLDCNDGGWELWIDAGQGDLRQIWQTFYDSEGNLMEKTYIEEDLSNTEQ